MFTVRVDSKINEAELTRALRGEDGPVGRYGTTKAREVTRVAKGKANVDTGLMQSKISSRTDRSGQELSWVIRVDTEYAGYVHNGNNSYEGNPFITDAIEEVFG
jgi:hypothetical protein